MIGLDSSSSNEIFRNESADQLSSWIFADQINLMGCDKKINEKMYFFNISTYCFVDSFSLTHLIKQQHLVNITN